MTTTDIIRELDALYDYEYLMEKVANDPKFATDETFDELERLRSQTQVEPDGSIQARIAGLERALREGA